MPYSGDHGSILARLLSRLFINVKYTNQHGNDKTIRRDANPFHGEGVNYTDAKFYKSLDSETSQVSSDLKGGNQKERPTALTLPQKVIRVVNNYASEAKEYQSP